jgi:MSHA biogenesis protein MshL
MNTLLKNSVLLLLAGATLSGCSFLDMNRKSMNTSVDVSRDAAIDKFARQKPTPVVNEIDAPYVEFKAVPNRKAPGPLNVKAAAAAFGPLMSELAKGNGYSVVFSDAVDTNRKVSVELNGSEVVDGLRTLAFMAGYVAVIDADTRTITVTDIATFTYKIPVNLLQALTATYSVGGDPVTQGGGSSGSSGSSASGNSSSGSSGTSGSGGGGSSGLRASFVVSGSTSTGEKSVRALLADIAGKNAAITVSDLGVITVRANAQSQQRVHRFLRSFVHDAMSQVDIEASVVDVKLDDEFSLGVDWSKVLSAKGLLGKAGQVALGGGTGGVVNPALTATFTNSSVSAVVTALRQLTDAKVISNPHILAINNTPATFFDGTELPYLGSVVATPSSTGINTTTQLSGSASYAINGVSFSVQPSIIDDKHVQITLVPVLSSVLSFQTFQLGSGGTLTAPQQATKQSFMKVMAESGKTLILGGIRYSTDSKTDSPAPILLGNLARSKSAQEIVILMRATVLPAADFDPLVGESP